MSTAKPSKANPNSLRSLGIERHLHPRIAFHLPAAQLARVRRHAAKRYRGQLAPAIRDLIDRGLAST